MLIPAINKSKKIIALLITLILVFAVSDTKIINNMFTNNEDKQVIKWNNQVCNIKAEYCDINLDNFSLYLALQPKILTYKHPINIEVSLTDGNYSEVTAEFIGKTMSMGLFPFKLKPSTEERYKFLGVGNIVFCTTDPNMQWMLQLKIISVNQIHLVPIELITL